RALSPRFGCVSRPEAYLAERLVKEAGFRGFFGPVVPVHVAEDDEGAHAQVLQRSELDREHRRDGDENHRGPGRGRREVTPPGGREQVATARRGEGGERPPPREGERGQDETGQRQAEPRRRGEDPVDG